jgi:hypothetical protein
MRRRAVLALARKASSVMVASKAARSAHIRQVHPGDHKRKLRADTIATLNNSLVTFLDAFLYLSTPGAPPGPTPVITFGDWRHEFKSRGSDQQPTITQCRDAR